MVCISSYYYEEHLIYNASVYEVWPNFSGSGTAHIEQTTINVNNIISYSTSNFSNFIIVEQRIYFAIGSIIVALDILDSTQTQQYHELSVQLELFAIEVFHCTIVASESYQKRRRSTPVSSGTNTILSDPKPLL